MLVLTILIVVALCIVALATSGVLLLPVAIDAGITTLIVLGIIKLVKAIKAKTNK